MRKGRTMYYALRTMGYFLTWGTIYGFLLGVWATTIILPVFGTMYGAIWGPGIGAACGLLCGIIVAMTQAMTFDTDTDLATYQRHIGRAIGLLVSIAAPVVLLTTSQGILWRVGRYESSGRPFLIPCLMAVIICGGLAAAYIAHTYPLWLADLRLRGADQDMTLKTSGVFEEHLSEQTDETILPSKHWHVFYTTLAIVRTAINWPTLALAGGAGALIHLSNSARYPFNLANLVGAAALSMIVISALIVTLSFGSAVLMVFLRTLVFSQQRAFYVPSYRRTVMTGTACVLTTLLTLYAMINVRGIELWAFLALWPILMTRYVYQAFPLFDIEQDKAKRKEKHADSKPKNTLVLDEDADDDGMPAAVSSDEMTARMNENNR